MNRKDLYNSFHEVDDDILERSETATQSRKKPAWLKWSAMAACLCLLVGGALLSRILSQPSAGGGANPSPGGAWPEDVDPLIASVAVYPVTEDVRNVETATYEEIDEATAYAMEGLGEHLPTWLPNDIFFHYASLYETTMRDGTKYYMLRAFYTAGEVIPSDVVDGETGEPLPDRLHDEFAVSVMTYKPNTKKSIHQIEDLPEFLSRSWEEGSTFHFECGDVYICFTPESSELSLDVILSVVDSIE